jgi:hypothetical protein
LASKDQNDRGLLIETECGNISDLSSQPAIVVFAVITAASAATLQWTVCGALCGLANDA